MLLYGPTPDFRFAPRDPRRLGRGRSAAWPRCFAGTSPPRARVGAGGSTGAHAAPWELSSFTFFISPPFASIGAGCLWVSSLAFSAPSALATARKLELSSSLYRLFNARSVQYRAGDTLPAAKRGAFVSDNSSGDRGNGGLEGLRWVSLTELAAMVTPSLVPADVSAPAPTS